MIPPSKAPFGDPLWLSRHIGSLSYTDSHRRLQQEARTYVDTHISPFCEQWELQGSVPLDVIQRHSELGYMAVSVYPLATDYVRDQRLPGDIKPEDWDGFHDLIVIDEIARCGYLGVIWALSCGNSIGAPPLVNFGTEQQKERFLPDVLHGKSRFCLGVTEPDGKLGRDLFFGFSVDRADGAILLIQQPALTWRASVQSLSDVAIITSSTAVRSG